VSAIFFDPPPAPASAAYLGSDTATQGTWTNKYGAQGQIIANDLNNPPAYATVSLAGDTPYTWAASTTNVSALQTASGATTRIASTYYSSTSFTINLNLTDGNTHKISLFLLDWLSNARAETITVSDAASNAVLSTQSYATFENGVYAEWNISGHVLIKVSKTAGSNAVVSGLFFDQPQPPATASYIGSDTTTQGTWTGKYGSKGQIIANDLNSPPSYATVSLSGDSPYTWAASTTNVSALQTASGASTRIASTYYSTTSETINLNLTDGATHKISLYLLDWLSNARTETITISDAVSNAVLSTESYATFENGEYAEWNISGHVLIKITKTGGANAVVSGIFFD
jgi:predicted lactoylglutathione lyase